MGYGSIHGTIEVFGNLAFEEPGFNYQNSGEFSAMFSDAINFNASRIGFIQIVATTGTAQAIRLPVATLTIGTEEFISDGEDIDSGLVNASRRVLMSLALDAAADSDDGLVWAMSIGSVRLFDVDGNQIRGFSYRTDSGSAYNIEGGTLTTIPEPSALISLATGIALIVWKSRRG